MGQMMGQIPDMDKKGQKKGEFPSFPGMPKMPDMKEGEMPDLFKGL